MSVQSNIQTVSQIYEAFGRGDIPSIIDKLDENVKWTCHFDKVVPWAGDWSGKSRVPKFFEAIGGSVDVLSFVPQEFVAEGDTVVSLGQFGSRVRATGKLADTRWCFVWKLRDGRVTSYEQFHDPKVAEAFRA